MNKIKPGDEAEIVIGPDWHGCRIVRVDEVPHWSGQSSDVYTVVFPNGDVMHASRNSLRETVPT